MSKIYLVLTCPSTFLTLCHALDVVKFPLNSKPLKGNSITSTSAISILNRVDIHARGYWGR